MLRRRAVPSPDQNQRASPFRTRAPPSCGRYALPGAPFSRLRDAVDALKGALMLAFNLSMPVANIYTQV